MGSAGTLVDAGPLYAVADRRDPRHEQSVEALEVAPRPLLVPALVVAEAAYLISTRLGSRAEVVFVGSIARGELLVEHVHARDWIRIASLVAQYHDLPLGTTDASIVAAAERLGIVRVATLDRRHFGIVRPAHVDLFDIVPG